MTNPKQQPFVLMQALDHLKFAEYHLVFVVFLPHSNDL